MIRLVFPAVAAVLLCAGIYAAAVRGLADWHSLGARAVLAAASQAKRLPETVQLSDARRALGRALALEPSNPLFVEHLGKVLEAEALSKGRGDPDVRPMLREALGQFRAAALMRPGSPFVWTAIAGLKLRLEEMDFEFYGALQRAGRLGPWEPAIQLALADIGFAAWRFLAQPAKTLVLEAVERGMRRQGDALRAIAARHGALAAVCSDPAARATGTALCVKK